MPEQDTFDFKKEIKEQLRKDLRPVLYAQGFILSKPTTYIREKEGLLQELYFKVEKGRLRPWASYRPIFDTRPIVTFGTDAIYPSCDSPNPYSGYNWVFLDDWTCEDSTHLKNNYMEKFLPEFEKLRLAIVNGIIPDFNEIKSLDKFITIYYDKGLIFQERAKSYGGPGDRNPYFDFILNVHFSRGMKRLALIFKEMENWDLPKGVNTLLEQVKNKELTDFEADEVFEAYCNEIRIANKLMKKHEKLETQFL